MMRRSGGALRRARTQTDFVSCYAAASRQKRLESEPFRRFDYDALTKRDKINLS
jgi:hypothetical protein